MPTGIALSDEQIAAAIEEMAEGVTLKRACEIHGFSYWNVVKRIRASEELTQLHARVREEYAHFQVQKMHDLAANIEDVNRARLMVDCIKWESARVLPKQYGDRLNVDGDIKHTVSILDAIRLAGSGESPAEVADDGAGAVR